MFKNKKHHWDKNLWFDNNPSYVCLVKEKFKQQFDALKSRGNKHFPVFLSRISPSLNSARMRIFCGASTNGCSKSLYSHRKIDYFNMCKKNGRRCTYQLKSPSWITVHMCNPQFHHSNPSIICCASKKHGRRYSYQLKSPSWITVWTDVRKFLQEMAFPCLMCLVLCM